MSEFRTVLKMNRSSRKLVLGNAILTTGSCFADAMGQRFIKYKFKCQSNPFGAVYNPLSIHKTLFDAMNGISPEQTSFVESQERHVNYHYHSQWNASSAPELQLMLEEELNAVRSFLKNASMLIITYGTAWGYKHHSTNQIVANCHKQPGTMFTKSLLTVPEIVSSFDSLHKALKESNPSCKVIVTVSPVRHIKDTLELNCVSKAVLRAATHQIAEQFSDVEYFPAYEIMMDDLRDYRFYKSDMIHPTEDAEEYIWKSFAMKYFDDAALSFLQNWDEIVAALQHRPFHPASSAHQQFLRTLIARLKKLQPSVDVTQEIAAVESQLAGV